MIITETERLQYMALLEREVTDTARTHSELSRSITALTHPSRWEKYEGCLTLEELEELRQSTKERQHRAFKVWYDLNERAKAENLTHSTVQKTAQLGASLIGVYSYMEVVKADRS